MFTQAFRLLSLLVRRQGWSCQELPAGPASSHSKAPYCSREARHSLAVRQQLKSWCNCSFANLFEASGLLLPASSLVQCSSIASTELLHQLLMMEDGLMRPQSHQTKWSCHDLLWMHALTQLPLVPVGLSCTDQSRLIAVRLQARHSEG